MILLTGATGYIGGRLLQRLQQQPVPLRCLCRNPQILRGRVSPDTEVVSGDLHDPQSLAAAFRGVETAVYLAHAMRSGSDFDTQERQIAINFAHAAVRAGVRRIVFLGGLAQGEELSRHMRSRAETGDLLRASGIQVIELRASIVIGAGSASFELIRALVERLPVMITPRWVHTAAQPIAIEDVIDYLAEAIFLKTQGNMLVEIGGADVTSYLGIMREYARQRKLRRWFFAVPFLSPGLSSRWLTLITPIYSSIGRCLIESVRTPSVVRRTDASAAFAVRPVGFRRAIEQALRNEEQTSIETRWSDAGCPQAWGAASEPPADSLRNVQEVTVPLNPADAFVPVRRIGGRTGWYFGNFLWKIRGFIDLMTGGVGMRRGRPDPEVPIPGRTLDFWRVQHYEPARRLQLLAEMRLPGRAWLEFRAEPQGPSTKLRQIAYFEPHGLLGLIYWYLLMPIHAIMFRKMLRNIAMAAVKNVALPTQAGSPRTVTPGAPRAVTP